MGDPRIGRCRVTRHSYTRGLDKHASLDAQRIGHVFTCSVDGRVLLAATDNRAIVCIDKPRGSRAGKWPAPQGFAQTAPALRPGSHGVRIPDVRALLQWCGDIPDRESIRVSESRVEGYRRVAVVGAIVDARRLAYALQDFGGPADLHQKSFGHCRPALLVLGHGWRVLLMGLAGIVAGERTWAW
jgi:hypothetical protein